MQVWNNESWLVSIVIWFQRAVHHLLSCESHQPRWRIVFVITDSPSESVTYKLNMSWWWCESFRVSAPWTAQHLCFYEPYRTHCTVLTLACVSQPINRQDTITQNDIQFKEKPTEKVFLQSLLKTASNIWNVVKKGVLTNKENRNLYRWHFQPL